MTRPQERLRAIDDMRRLLAEVPLSEPIPEPMRGQAASILKDYPSMYEMSLLIQEKKLGLPASFVNTFVVAYEWLEQLKEIKDLSSEASRLAEGVSRHFPSPACICHAGLLYGQLSTPFDPSIRDWIDFDGTFL